jgi:hypothetical protein
MRRISGVIFGICLAGLVTADPIKELDQVGTATLRVLFWTIYNSTLYSIDGEFRGVEPGIALELTYRRRITTTTLIDWTRREWQKQSLSGEQSEEWLEILSTIWSDVKRGDVLVLKVSSDLSSEFYKNDELIGSLTDPLFTSNFLSIFISEKSSYPKLRARLVGIGAD